MAGLEVGGWTLGHLQIEGVVCLPAPGNHRTTLFLSKFDCSEYLHVSRIIQYLFFGDWHVSLSLIAPGFTQVAAWISDPPLTPILRVVAKGRGKGRMRSDCLMGSFLVK